jgi:hypothetical protein
MIFTAVSSIGSLTGSSRRAAAPDPDIRQPRWTVGPLQMNAK